MAAACRTRSQMNWVSVVVILSMSALGGSMVPRYLMSESMQNIGWATFNAWALEGYQKVFWRDLPVIELWKELAILTACAVGFLVAARYLMARWIQE
jgi:ABC-2 type transport system permease protein